MNVLTPIAIEKIIAECGLQRRLPGCTVAFLDHRVLVNYGSGTYELSLHYITGPGRDAEAQQVESWAERVITQAIADNLNTFRPDPWLSNHLFDLATAVLRTSGFQPHEFSTRISAAPNHGLAVSWPVQRASGVTDDQLAVRLTEADAEALRSHPDPFGYVIGWAHALAGLIRGTKTGIPRSTEWQQAYVLFFLATVKEQARLVAVRDDKVLPSIEVYRRNEKALGNRGAFLAAISIEEKEAGYSHAKLVSDAASFAKASVEELLVQERDAGEEVDLTEAPKDIRELLERLLRAEDYDAIEAVKDHARTFLERMEAPAQPVSCEDPSVTRMRDIEAARSTQRLPEPEGSMGLASFGGTDGPKDPPAATFDCPPTTVAHPLPGADMDLLLRGHKGEKVFSSDLLLSDRVIGPNGNDYGRAEPGFKVVCDESPLPPGTPPAPDKAPVMTGTIKVPEPVLPRIDDAQHAVLQKHYNPPAGVLYGIRCSPVLSAIAIDAIKHLESEMKA